MIQQLWVEKKGWDDSVSSIIVSTWTSLAADLQRLSTQSIQRYIGPPTDTQGEIDLQLHCFCDAAASAYGAAVYLRVSCFDGVTCNLLFAKSRVAPLKKELKIPKLELVACTVGSLLLDFVSKESGLVVSKKVGQRKCLVGQLLRSQLGAHQRAYLGVCLQSCEANTQHPRPRISIRANGRQSSRSAESRSDIGQSHVLEQVVARTTVATSK